MFISVNELPVMWQFNGIPPQSSVTSYPGGRSSTLVTFPEIWLRADELASLSAARITSEARTPHGHRLPDFWVADGDLQPKIPPRS